MRILLSGKNGQVGFELQRSLALLGEVFAVGKSDCDFSDASAVRALFDRVRPDIIINPAAYTAVDKAESDYGTAFAVNHKAVQVLGEEAARFDAFVVHFSTDYVFDGDKTDAYTETDTPNPKSVYGESKLAGELALAAANHRSLILRTSWVVGAHGNNFAKTILRLAADRTRLSVVADQFGAPTSAALLADLTAQLIRRYQANGAADFPYGTYHVTASGETCWHEYARFVIGHAIAAGVPLKATTDTVDALSTADYPTPAIRPANSRLNTQRFQDTFGLCLPQWEEGVSRILQQLLKDAPLCRL